MSTKDVYFILSHDRTNMWSYEKSPRLDYQYLNDEIRQLIQMKSISVLKHVYTFMQKISYTGLTGLV